MTVLYEKLAIILSQKEEWKHKDLKKELNMKYRFTKEDYRHLLKEIKENPEIESSKHKIVIHKFKSPKI